MPSHWTSRREAIPCMLAIVSLVTPDWLPAAGGYTWVELGSLPGGSGIARGLSNQGEVAGRSGALHGTGTHAFIWTPKGDTQAIGALLGGDDNRAVSINGLGEVVGFSNTATSIHAFLWSRKKGIQDLGRLPGDSGSRAYAISDMGEVVGSSSGPRGIRAFLWTSSKGMQELPGLPGATYTEALGINNSGQVVGASGNSQVRRALDRKSVCRERV